MEVSSLKKKYIIALDLDETLLNSKKEISLKTLDVLNKCKEKGCVIVISSARGYGSCLKIAKIISADYICCQSGNMIADENGEMIYQNPFNQEEVANLIEELKPHTKVFVMDSDKNLFGGLNDDFAKSWGVIHCDLESLKKVNAYKMCVGFTPEIKDLITEYCNKYNYVCREMKTDPYMLITPANTDKFYALEKLIQILNTDLKHLLVFGDDNSDLLSIQKAGYGVAVANSKEEVLREAKFITASNDDDGVAVFLENFINLEINQLKEA